MNSVTEAGGERKLKEHVGGYFSNQWPVASVYRGDGACEERADPSATPRDDKPVEGAKRSPVGTTAKSRSPAARGMTNKLVRARVTNDMGASSAMTNEFGACEAWQLGREARCRAKPGSGPASHNVRGAWFGAGPPDSRTIYWRFIRE